jgi:hypothetical protein
MENAMPRTTAARVTKTRPATGPAKPIADTNEAPQQDRAGFNMDELVRGGSDIEVVTADKDLVRVMKEAAFFEEILKIRFHETTDENAPRLVELGVGISPMKGGKGGKDVRRGFERGKIYDVPRFMVEIGAHAKVSALARSRARAVARRHRQRDQALLLLPVRGAARPEPERARVAGEGPRGSGLTSPCARSSTLPRVSTSRRCRWPSYRRRRLRSPRCSPCATTSGRRSSTINAAQGQREGARCGRRHDELEVEALANVVASAVASAEAAAVALKVR